MFAVALRRLSVGAVRASGYRGTGNVGSGGGGCGLPLRVTLIEGQGSGPIVCAAARKIVEATGVPVLWDRHTLRVLPDPVTGRLAVDAGLLQSAAETGLVLRYPDSSPAADGSHGSATLALHKALGAFVGVKLFESADGHRPFGPGGVVNIRDNVSGEYSETEHTVVPGKWARRYGEEGPTRPFPSRDA